MWRPCGGLECDCASNGESGTGLHGAAPFFDQREKENSRLAAVRLLRPSAIFNAGAGEERARAKTKQQPERLCSRCSLRIHRRRGGGVALRPTPHLSAMPHYCARRRFSTSGGAVTFSRGRFFFGPTSNSMLCGIWTTRSLTVSVRAR
jgi:hypothetical protein